MNVDMDLTPILVSSVFFLTSAVIVAMFLFFVHRSKVLRHETIRMALEKGQPLPSELLETRRRTPACSDLTRGVKAVFIGVGLSLFFWFVHRELWPVGLVVIFVGLGHLAAHALTGRAAPAAPPTA
jgi:hypothetical protein